MTVHSCSICWDCHCWVSIIVESWRWMSSSLESITEVGSWMPVSPVARGATGATRDPGTNGSGSAVWVAAATVSTTGCRGAPGATYKPVVASSFSTTGCRGAAGATYNRQPRARVCGRCAAPPVSHVVQMPRAMRRSRSRGPVRPRDSLRGSATAGGGGGTGAGGSGDAGAAAAAATMASPSPPAPVGNVAASCAPARAGTVVATGLFPGDCAVNCTRCGP